jgi:glycosyltransferase involved in cell wall biosynthesis
VLSGSREVRWVGGAEVQQSYIARGLVQQGYRVSMLCLDYGQPARTEVQGVEVHRLHRPDAGLPVLRFLHPRLTSFWRGMRTVGADIYYQRGADMLTGVVAAFCRVHGRKSIFAGAHNTDFYPTTPLIRYGRDRWLYERGVRYADAIVAQNEAQQRDCLLNYARHAALVRSCYPAPAARRGAGDGGVLWVSTLREWKYPERFVALARALPEYRFTMIGGPGGSDAEAGLYERMRIEAARISNLSFLGFVHPQDVESHFDGARVVVNTSDVEGFPNTFLQAWSREVPTVSWFDPGCVHGGLPVGCIVANAAEAAACVRRLMEDELYWKAVGARCRGYFDANHSVPGVIDAYRAILDTLVRPGSLMRSAGPSGSG